MIYCIVVADNIMTYTVFLEIAPPDSPLSSLPSFDKDQVNCNVFSSLLLVNFQMVLAHHYHIQHNSSMNVLGRDVVL